MNKVNLAARATLIASACFGTFAVAQAQTTLTGNIASSITLENGCNVNGAPAVNGFSFGNLAFGTHNTEFNEADAQVGGSSGFSLQCTSGMTVTYTIGASLHPAAFGLPRSMQHGTVTTARVGYQLYRDVARTDVMPATAQTVVADGTAHTIAIYGRAKGGAGLVAGLYQDSVAVTLNF